MNPKSLNRADFITAVDFIVLGVAVLYGSWTMPRLEVRGVHPSSVPGLVPGLLGVALAVSGAVLAVRAARLGGHRALVGEGSFAAWLAGGEARRLGTVTALSLGYALVLVRNLPFWLATLLFVFAFIVVFEWEPGQPRGRRLRSVLAALVQAAATAAVVSYVFQELFLVRLP